VRLPATAYLEIVAATNFKQRVRTMLLTTTLIAGIMQVAERQRLSMTGFRESAAG